MKDIEQKNVDEALDALTPEEYEAAVRAGRAEAWARWYAKPESKKKKAEYNRRYYAARAIRAKLEKAGPNE